MTVEQYCAKRAHEAAGILKRSLTLTHQQSEAVEKVIGGLMLDAVGFEYAQSAASFARQEETERANDPQEMDL